MKLVKILISVFLFYHLMCIAIMPNYHSVLGKIFGPYFLKYANTLTLANTWQFFSPDPTVEFYFEYQLDLKSKELDAGSEASAEESFEDKLDGEMKVYRWPPKKNTFLYRPSYFRRIYHSRLATRDQYRMKKFFIPWVCKKHPDAIRINLRSVSGLSPLMHDSALEKELESKTNFEYKVASAGSYDCDTDADTDTDTEVEE